VLDLQSPVLVMMEVGASESLELLFRSDGQEETIARHHLLVLVFLHLGVTIKDMDCASGLWHKVTRKLLRDRCLYVEQRRNSVASRNKQLILPPDS
jgi:hypothetical protein